MKNMLVIMFLLTVVAVRAEDGVMSHKLIGTGTINKGNTNTSIIEGAGESKYERSKDSLLFKAAYLLGRDEESVINSRQWNFSLRYDRKIKINYSVFAALGYEGDKFAGFRKRRNIDLGAAKRMGKVDTELGYRYTLETPSDESSEKIKASKLRVAAKYEKKMDIYTYGFSTELLKTLSAVKINNEDKKPVNANTEIYALAPISKNISFRISELWKYNSNVQHGFVRDDYLTKFGVEILF